MTECGQKVSLYDWGVECCLPLGHEGSHVDHGRHYRYEDTGDDVSMTVPIGLAVSWWDSGSERSDGV